MDVEPTLTPGFELPLKSLPDRVLLERLTALTLQSRHAEAALLAHMAEVDRRGLYLGEACSSMFAYCTERLHLSEPEAYFRITAARAAREHAPLLEMLADGRLHLSAIVLLAPHLTADNRDALLASAVHRSKRQVEELVAELSPRPDVPGTIRKLPEQPPRATRLPNGTEPSHAGLLDRSAGGELRPDGVAPALPDASGRREPVRFIPSPGVSACAAAAFGQPGRTPVPARPATVEPIAAARYQVTFTASAELRDKLERLRDLMRVSVPDGDLATVIEQAVTEKLQRLEARRFARTARPRKTVVETDANAASRHVPAATRRAVHERDEGRCAFIDDHGRRCTRRGRLEFHHRMPYGYGGAHTVGNVGLLCAPHNRYLAGIDYGKKAIADHGKPARGGAEAPTPSGRSPIACEPSPAAIETWSQ